MSSPTKLRQMAKELGWPPELEKAADQLQKLERENAELRNEIARLNNQTNWVCKCGGTDCEGQKENAALREDKERLDYMEKNVDFVSWMYCGKPHSWDFRKKIDAKRKEAQP